MIALRFSFSSLCVSFLFVVGLSESPSVSCEVQNSHYIIPISQILCGKFLKSYGKDVINIHQGLLPSFKGGNPSKQVSDSRLSQVIGFAYFINFFELWLTSISAIFLVRLLMLGWSWLVQQVTLWQKNLMQARLLNRWWELFCLTINDFILNSLLIMLPHVPSIHFS